MLQLDLNVTQERTVNVTKSREVITRKLVLLEKRLDVTLEILDDPSLDFYVIDALYEKEGSLVGSLRQIIHKEPPPGPFPQRDTLSEY